MSGVEQRKHWIEAMTKIARPVMEALSQEKLKETLPQDLNATIYVCTVGGFWKNHVRNCTMAGSRRIEQRRKGITG